MMALGMNDNEGKTVSITTPHLADFIPRFNVKKQSLLKLMFRFFNSSENFNASGKLFLWTQKCFANDETNKQLLYQQYPTTYKLLIIKSFMKTDHLMNHYNLHSKPFTTLSTIGYHSI